MELYNIEQFIVKPITSHNNDKPRVRLAASSVVETIEREVIENIPSDESTRSKEREND